MLTGGPPFEAKGQEQLQSRILNVRISYPEHMPEEARDLIGKLLNPVAEKRIELSAILSHPFFESVEPEKT